MNSMSKFTKGPWEYDGIVITGADGQIIHNNQRWPDEKEANAKLIAAAPEMYGFLKELSITESFKRSFPNTCEEIKELLNRITPLPTSITNSNE